MFRYYRIGEEICLAGPGEPVPGDCVSAAPEEVRAAARLTWLFYRAPGTCRASFLVSDLNQLFQKEENASWLSSRELSRNASPEAAILDREENAAEKAMLEDHLHRGRLRAVNVCQPDWEQVLKEGAKGRDGASGPAFLPAGKKKVNILAIGDVGSNLLTGLHLLGGDCISEIGICDLDD